MSDYDDLRAELAALKAQVAALSRQAAPAGADDDEQVSRRGLFGKLAGAAVAGAGLSVLGAAPAEATAGYMRFGESNAAGTDQTSLTATTPSYLYALSVVQAGKGSALNANVTDGSSTAPTVLAHQNGGGNAVEGLVLKSNSTSAGVYGYSPRFGVHGSSPNIGVAGYGYQGVMGRAADGIGVHAIDDAAGRGLSAFSNTGDAIVGYSNGGYGAWLSSQKAPLRLHPNGMVGPPADGQHEVGEVRPDANGVLWLCVAPGDPGTWVRPGFNPLVKRLVSAATTTGSYAAAQRKDVTVTGIPAGIGAVALNLTATSTGSGSITVYPYGTTRPGVAHLAVNPQYRWTGFAIVRLGAGNKFSVYNSAGTTKLSIDLAGFFA